MPASPPVLTTLGSVPHPTVESAIDFIQRLFDSYPHVLPTWPQLSQGNPPETMGKALLQVIPGVLPTDRGGRILNTPPGVELTDFDVDLYRAREAEEAFSRCAPGYAAFREALSRRDFGSAPPVKSPLVGPVTLATLLELSDGRSALEDPAVCDRLARLVAAMGGAMAVELRERGAGAVHVWLDEPAWNRGLGTDLERHGWRARYVQLLRTLHQADIRVGIHCCADTDFTSFAGLGLDVLSFDAAHYLDRFVRSLDAFRPELDAGRLEIAWGIIDTWEPDREVDIPALVESWRIVSKSLPGRGILSPACGLGLLTIPQAEKVQARLVEFVQIFAKNVD